MLLKKSTKTLDKQSSLQVEPKPEAAQSNIDIENLIKTAIEQNNKQQESLIKQVKEEIINDNNKFQTKLLAKINSLESSRNNVDISSFVLDTAALNSSDIQNGPNGSSELRVTGMHLLSGKSVSADKINNELASATANIKLIKNKLELVAQKVNSLNTYMASHNFKKDKPTQEELDTFAIRCLSAFGAYIKREQIPAGTCIKNTFDNHIWIFNKFTACGLTSYKWEDYGLNLISIADNFGTHGIVAGSNDKFRGYVDLNGVISINGLEEELATIVAAVNILENSLQQYKSDIEKRLSALEGR